MKTQIWQQRCIQRRTWCWLALVSALMMCCGTWAQQPLSADQLDELRAKFYAGMGHGGLIQATGEPQLAVSGGIARLAHPSGVLSRGLRDFDPIDLYVGIQPEFADNNFWSYGAGVYWALDDGELVAFPPGSGGGRVAAYQFSFALAAPNAGYTVEPYVVVSFFEAPTDPVGDATNPVVDPAAPVHTVAWHFEPIVLQEPGLYVRRTELLDLAAEHVAWFDLNEAFYIEILPLAWDPQLEEAVFSPNIHAVFTGPGSVSVGDNQNVMWSDQGVRLAGGGFAPSDGDGLYDHPAEMDMSADPVFMNQSGFRLVGTDCTDPNVLRLRINEPADVCVRPGEILQVTLSQDCLTQPVRGYQAFLEFDPGVLDFVSGLYETPIPYGLPILTPIVASPTGEINLAAGIDDPAGQVPTTLSADLARLNFLADGSGATSVVFRVNDPPTRFSDETGQAIVPTLETTRTICVDGEAPDVDCPPDPGVDCIADVPEPATDLAEFEDQGGFAIDLGCGAEEPLSLSHLGDTDNGGSGCGSDPLVIQRSYGVSDCAGNLTVCTQTITVLDDMPPVITGCPEDIEVDADPGDCSAVVTWVPPTASDNCSVPVTLESTHEPGDAFDVGTTTVIYTATDWCGNITTCEFDVTVTGVNQLTVNVAYSPTMASATITRCITFEIWSCPDTEPTLVIDTDVEFVDGVAAGIALEIPCGDFTCITARDKLHTLRRTLVRSAGGSFDIVGGGYLADFIGADKPLIGGNLNGDAQIDILDYIALLDQYLTPIAPNTPCGTVGPHADINGDGLVDSWDYTFIQINYLEANEPDCCGQLDGAEDNGMAAAAMSTLRALADQYLTVVDVDGDGHVEEADVRAVLRHLVSRGPERQSLGIVGE